MKETHAQERITDEGARTNKIDNGRTTSKKNFGIKGNLLLVVGAVAVSLAMSEWYFYRRGWYQIPDYPPNCIYWDSDICAMYEEYNPHGYRLRPSRSTQYLYPREHPRRLTVVSNKHGFRGARELDERDSRRRIIVLGDSMVLGEGVEERERFSDVLETLQPSWRVDNLGMTGYGADLMIMAFEVVGWRLKPDVVVLSMYTHDFFRVHPYYVGVGFKNPRFKLQNGELTVVPYPKATVLERTRTYQAIWRWYYDYSDTEWRLNQAILDRFLFLAEKHKFTPAIIFLPGTGDTEIDKQRRIWLRRYAENNGTPFLDLSDPIHSSGVKRVFIPNNPHLNPEGHRIVARELHSFLAKHIGDNQRSTLRQH